jgi:hypothetical protein
MNPDEKKLDLSALDPMQDPVRWQALFDATMVRVDAALSARAADPIVTIAGWRRPLLLAAAIALALLVPIELVLESKETRAEQVERLVSLSAGVVRAAAPPSGADFRRALAEARR